MSVLSINAGSSSIRFSFHGTGSPPAKLLDGKIERIGQRGTNLSVAATEPGTDSPPRLAVNAAAFQNMTNHESGLLGLSETSSDMRDLLARERGDVRAAEAVALFCYQAKKWIGAYAAALGGLDTLVFAGGIGENAAPVRARICDGLQFLGIALREERNARNAPVISSDAGRVTVRVMRTDEESVIAGLTIGALGLKVNGSEP